MGLLRGDFICLPLYTLPMGERGGLETYSVGISPLKGRKVSPEDFPTWRFWSSHFSIIFLLSSTAIHTENACSTESDELNSTEKIPSLNGAKANNGRFSWVSTCKWCVHQICISILTEWDLMIFRVKRIFSVPEGKVQNDLLLMELLVSVCLQSDDLQREPSVGNPDPNLHSHKNHLISTAESMKTAPPYLVNYGPHQEGSLSYWQKAPDPSHWRQHPDAHSWADMDKFSKGSGRQLLQAHY